MLQMDLIHYFLRFLYLRAIIAVFRRQAQCLFCTRTTRSCRRQALLEQSIIATKLYIPRLRPGLVVRPRLLERLNGGIHAHLTLIAAPAGFGKSTLLGQWIEQFSGDVAWLALDADDNDPIRFWTYLIAALRTRSTGIGTRSLALLETPQPQPLPTILAHLVNDLAQLPHDITLVLDDYHEISAEAIHESLAYLLDHQPPQLHLILATRVDPPLPLPRLRVRGELTELRSAELRFTETEAGAFFSQAMGLSLTSAQVKILESRTEGWIAGLQLAALSVREHPDVERFLAAFTGSHRYVVDYLAEEIFQQQPQTVQEFLLKTSILERLTADLCNAITEGTDSQSILEELEQTNLLLVPLDEQRRWFRYHQLLATFLRNRLLAQEQAALPPLHRRAAAWYQAQGMAAEAIFHLLAVEAWDEAAGLIERAVDDVLLRGETASAQRWLDSLPESIVQARPSLSITRAWLGVLYGEGGERDALIEAAVHSLRSASERDELSEQAYTQAQSHIEALQANQALLRGELERASNWPGKPWTISLRRMACCNRWCR